MFWLLLGLVSAILLLMMYTRKKDSNLPPGPKGLPFVGNITDIDTTNIHHCLDSLSKKYGPVMHIKLLQRNIIVLSSCDILKKAFKNPEFRELLNDKPRGFYGTHLLYNHQDVLLGPYSDVTFKLKAIMHRGLQSAMKHSVIEKEIKDVMEKFEATDGKDVDPQEVIRTTLGNLTAFILSGEPKAGDSKLMWDFVDTSSKLLNPSMEAILKNFPSLRHLPGKYSNLYISARDCRDALVRRFLDEYRDSFIPGRTRGLVDTCLNMQLEDREGSSWLTDDMIRALILDTVGAGLVATTNTILGSILTLLHHKQIIQRMRDEVHRMIGKDHLPSINDQSDLPYCHAVILELLRYKTVVPLVNHFCSKQDVSFEHFTIPKNSVVWGNFWTAHHDDTIYTEPWSFKPERFLDENGRLLPADHRCRQSLFPFGIGARVCVGDDLAKKRLFAYMSALVQKFNILPPVEKKLISCDPKLYHSGAVLQIDDFSCRFLPV